MLTKMQSEAGRLLRSLLGNFPARLGGTLWSQTEHCFGFMPCPVTVATQSDSHVAVHSALDK